MARIKDLGGPTMESPLLAQRARLRARAHHWLDTGELPEAGTSEFLLVLAEARTLYQETTQRKELEDAQGKLARAQDRHAKLFDLVPAGILVTSLAGRITEVNAAFAHIVGLDRTFIHDRSLASFVSSEDERALTDHILKAMQGETHTTQLTLIRQDSQPVPARLSSLRGEDEQGQPVLLNVLLDISEDIAAYKKRQQMERMEMVSQLTGGIAQEFNNLLTAMMGATDLLSGWLHHDAEAGALVEHIQEILQRGTDLTQQLLTFAQRRAILPRPLELDLHLTQRKQALERVLGSGLTLKLDLHAPGSLVLLDPAGLDSTLINLIQNARDATPAGGAVVISTSLAHRPSPDEERPTPMILLRVQDTGSGIAPEHLSRIFEPFFTTRPVGQGKGLGLSMVKGFFEQARGQIEATSALGRGTTMLIYLPIYTPPALPQPVASPTAQLINAPALKAQRRVLLVEDNEFVRTVTARHLARWGFDVVQVETGDEALPLIKTRRLDAIITDMVMPGQTSGAGVVSYARQLWPTLPILITTGYTDDDMLSDEGITQSATLRVLAKPYDSATLEEELKALLGDKT